MSSSQTISFQMPFFENWRIAVDDDRNQLKSNSTFAETESRNVSTIKSEKPDVKGEAVGILCVKEKNTRQICLYILLTIKTHCVSKLYILAMNRYVIVSEIHEGLLIIRYIVT